MMSISLTRLKMMRMTKRIWKSTKIYLSEKRYLWATAISLYLVDLSKKPIPGKIDKNCNFYLVLHLILGLIWIQHFSYSHFNMLSTSFLCWSSSSKLLSKRITIKMMSFILLDCLLLCSSWASSTLSSASSSGEGEINGRLLFLKRN